MKLTPTDDANDGKNELSHRIVLIVAILLRPVGGVSSFYSSVNTPDSRGKGGQRGAEQPLVPATARSDATWFCVFDKQSALRTDMPVERLRREFDLQRLLFP
jgi:hypothetical protein